MHDTADNVAQTAQPQSRVALVDESQASTAGGAAAALDQVNAPGQRT